MAQRVFGEMRSRLFLGFLIIVLVIVNSQSLQLSHQTLGLLRNSFRDALRIKTEWAASQCAPWLEAATGLEGLGALSTRLDELAGESELAAVCVFDWSGALLSGSDGCGDSPVSGLDRLGTGGKQALVQEGWASTDVDPPYQPDEARAFGYRTLPAVSGSMEVVLRVEVLAGALSLANRHFRTTLIYQVSAFALVLLTLFLYLNSLLTTHRRLVAEARSVVGNVSASPESANEGQFILSTFQSVVAQLKQKELQLAEMHRLEKVRADETEALATDIIRSMTTGLVSLDASGTVVLVNPSAEKIFGMEASAVVGRRFDEVFTGSRELADWLESARSGGQSTHRGQVTYRRADGEPIHLGVNVVPLIAPEGGLKGVLCLHADLTEVTRLRERLMLKENLARLGEMAAGIAHEFRNGLATILGNAKLLGQNLEGPEAAELVRGLSEEANSLSHVVNEFLHFARPQALRPAVVDLGELAGDLAEELEPRMGQLGIRFDVRLEPESVEADEVLIRKAVRNLLLNAMEAVVSVDAAVVELRVEPGGRGDSVWVRVSDNGRGIAPENLNRVFTPFFTTKPDGTGLGLALVQKIAVAHDGDVHVESQPHVKTTFTLRLPRRQRASAGLPDWV